MIKKFEQHIRNSGNMVTQPRLTVFKFLQEHDPTTGHEVIDSLCSEIDRASIYRTLGLFRKLGIIQDIVAGGKRMIELTDNFDTHHHHISCVKCGATKTIEDVGIEARLKHIAAMQGFTNATHHMAITGICNDCRLAG